MAISKARLALVERLASGMDAQLPSYVVRAPDGVIDDGCDYDRGYDPRPEIVKEEDSKARRRRERGNDAAG